jgi:hypothetical protein
VSGFFLTLILKFDLGQIGLSSYLRNEQNPLALTNYSSGRPEIIASAKANNVTHTKFPFFDKI